MSNKYIQQRTVVTCSIYLTHKESNPIRALVEDRRYTVFITVLVIQAAVTESQTLGSFNDKHLFLRDMKPRMLKIQTDLVSSERFFLYLTVAVF